MIENDQKIVTQRDESAYVHRTIIQKLLRHQEMQVMEKLN